MYIMISESTGTSLGSWDCRCSWLILETSVLDIPTKCRKYSGIPPIAHPSLIWSSTPNHFLTIATIINITIKFTTITSIIIFFLLSSSSSIIFGWLNPRVSGEETVDLIVLSRFTELPFWCHRSSLMYLWYPAPKEKTASDITYQELKSSNFHSPFTTWFTQISQRNQATEGQHHAFAELWTKTFYDVMLLQKPTSRFLQWWTLQNQSSYLLYFTQFKCWWGLYEWVASFFHPTKTGLVLFWGLSVAGGKRFKTAEHWLVDVGISIMV